MKAFWSGVGLMIVVAVIAWAGLDTIDRSAEGVYTSDHSVRLH